MMSLHRSMHSSQMYTPGPAISFLTCFCDLPQKLHFTRSLDSPNLATGPPLDSLRHAGGLGQARQLPCVDDLINDAVVLGFVGAHDEVPVGIKGDLLDRLARV